MKKVSATILKKHKVTAEDTKRIRAAEQYDLEFLSSAFNDTLIRGGRPFSIEQVYPIIARFGKADYEIAKRLEEEFKRFVVLTLIKPKVPHAPPGAVDMYWHFFILHTTEYAEFCKDVWGTFEGHSGYRHHYPSTDETRPGQFRAYASTLKLYLEVYGQPEEYERDGASPVAIWTSVNVSGVGILGSGSDTSGDSYSGIINPFEYERGIDLETMGRDKKRGA